VSLKRPNDALRPPVVSPTVPTRATWPSCTVPVVTATDHEHGLPIRLLHDRVLVRLEGNEGERRSAAGIVIPATASVGRRLSWATAVGVGPHVRSIVTGDRVLFDPDERSEVELQGRDYILLRERDVHAVAASRVEPDATGLYL
jgi:chaperonin GroES